MPFLIDQWHESCKFNHFISMKTSALLPYLFLTTTALLFLQCNSASQEYEDQEEMVDVAYIIPNYEQPNQLSAKIAVTAAKDYAQAGKIITYGQYIFINRPMEGIHVVDNSNPSNPVNMHFISIPGSLDMSIIDNHLYTDMYSALVVFSIEDITAPELLSDFIVEDVFYYDPYIHLPETIDESTPYRNYEPIDNTQGIVTSWRVEIRQEPLEDQIMYAIDRMEIALEATTSSADQPQTQTSTAGSMTRFLPVDNYLYTINFNELILFAIGSDYRPSRFARVDTGTQAETLFLLNDLLFVGSTTGMLMYDVATASNPEYLNSIEHFRSCDPVVADSAYAYVTLRGGTNCFTDLNELQIIDIQNPQEALEVVARQVLFNPHGLAIHNDHLIVCDGTAGIKVLDVSDRTNPRIITTENIPFAYDIIVDYPNATVVGESVIYQYDLSNLPNMTKVAELPLSN